MHTALNLRTHSPQFEPHIAGTDTLLEGVNAPHSRILERVL
jgi:hypothetical protein